MKIVPTLWLGPKRLLSRPVETLLLVLAVALGTLASLTGADAFRSLMLELDAMRETPKTRMIYITSQDYDKLTAVMPEERYERLRRQVVSQQSSFQHWFDGIKSQLQNAVAGYYRYACSARVRLDGEESWTDVSSGSSIMEPDWATAENVRFMAGRCFTQNEFDAGGKYAVIGKSLAERLFGKGTPESYLDRTFDVLPRQWETTSFPFRVSVIGVTERDPDGERQVLGNPDEWLMLTRDAGADWGTADVLADDIEHVPGLARQLRELMARDPSVASLNVATQYATYVRQVGLTWIVGFCALGMGAATLLIALWTIGSIFSSRLPSLKMSFLTMRAVGASRRILVFMGLTELLPASVAGIFSGVLGNIAVRIFVRKASPLSVTDPPVLIGILAVTFLIHLLQVLPVMYGRDIRGTGRETGTALTGPAGIFRHPGRLFRVAVTLLFLAGGLAMAYMGTSIQQEVGKGISLWLRPHPWWIGNTVPAGGNRHYTRGISELTADTVGVVNNLISENDWSPVLNDSSMVDNLLIKYDGNAKTAWIRTKVYAWPSYLDIYGLGLTAGRIPERSEFSVKACAMVSEEVATGLYGSSRAAVGKTITSIRNDTALAEFEITGVYGNALASNFKGMPDVLLIPSDAVLTALIHPYAGNEFIRFLAFHPERVSGAVLRESVIPALRSAHPGIGNLELWQGTNDTDTSGDGYREYRKSIISRSDETMVTVVVLIWVFLLVTCLSVLSYMFISVTSRAHETALERALGRSFAYYIGRCFARGAVLTLAASLLAVAIAVPVMPVLSAGLADRLGNVVTVSSGIIPLSGLMIVVVSLGAAALSGAIAVLPLLAYRNIPLMTLLKEDA